MLYTKSGIIYIVKNKEIIKDYYKVGYTTSSVGKRIFDSKNAFTPASNLEPLAIYSCLNPRQIEAEIHSKLASKRDKKTEWFRIPLNELKDLIKDTIYKNDKKVFIEKEIFEDDLASAVPSTNDNDDTEINTSTSPKKKEKKGSFLKIVGILFWSIGILAAIGGGGIAAVFVIVVGVVMHLSFR